MIISDVLETLECSELTLFETLGQSFAVQYHDPTPTTVLSE